MVAAPNDKDKFAVLQLQIKQALRDRVFASEVENKLEKLRTRVQTFSVHHLTSGGSQFVAPVGRGFIGNTIDLSVGKAPTVKEIALKEQIDKIESILDQFDRRSVRDRMHDENIAMMIKSLLELRVSVQKMGISTIRDETIRLLFAEVTSELEDIDSLAALLIEENRTWQSEHSNDGLLDLRLADLGEESRSEAISSTKARVRYRVESVRKFCDSLKSRGSIRSHSDHLFTMYLFGCIDQLKDQISSQLRDVRYRLRDLEDHALKS